MESLRSPKNKYQGVIYFDAPVEDLGSTIHFTSNDIAHLKNLCSQQAQSYPCKIVIFENKAVYPSFDWQEVESYVMNR